MAEFVLEVGCEELPASGIEAAARFLGSTVASKLREARVECSEPVILGTPRRLLVHLAHVAERQADATERKRGPAVAAAFSEEGNPTKALEGFCRGQGVAVEDLENDGQYVWVNKNLVGEPTRSVLGPLVEESLSEIPWSKTMRWGHQRIRFARPVRWLVAILDGKTIPVTWAGVTSGNQSRGHRFEAPDPFAVTSWDQLLSELRNRKVEPDGEVRMARVREGAVAVADGTPDLSDELVYENAYLSEWPEALQGTFDEEYSTLPEPVLITTMAKHERFFPIRDRSGAITNRFVSIRGGGVEADVRKGNEWVLRARFNDARFFYDEDQRFTLDDFLARTSAMTFQESLGSVRQRADRLSSLASLICKELGGDSVQCEWARQAGLYAKADLSSGLVGELDELQGQVGGHYASREGMPAEVAHAIATHYDVQANLGCETPTKRVGAAVTIADQMDKLAGYLGIGKVPTGSSDPAGLRRAVNIVIEMIESQPANVDIHTWCEYACNEYADQAINIDGVGVPDKLLPLLEQRYRSRYEVPADHLEAALGTEAAFTPLGVRFRVEVAGLVAADQALREALSRPMNIVASEEKKGNFVEPLIHYPQYESERAETLELVFKETELVAASHLAAKDAKGWVDSIRKLQSPIHDFFETTMVMADDAKVRQSRLGLMQRISTLLGEGADFTKLAG
ncbi:MAG: glycine--tRNA ligase subunit beta [Fimbriimonadaceae bacterium]|nr:glycine--tRNA ligase subunit beta [Fimbriimonadaceae bacterium]